MNSTYKKARWLLLAVSSAALLAACGGGNDDDFDDRADIADPTARFVHAVPGGPTVSLFRNGGEEPRATDVDYKFASQYYDIGSGATRFSLRTGPADTVLARVTVDSERGNKYTVLALPTAVGAELLTIVDPYNKSLTSDDARVRFFNASVNAQNLDVYLTAPGVNLNTIGPTIAAVGYKEAEPASGSDSVELEGGTYQLRITAAGSKTPVFTASVVVPEDGDWLLVSLADDDALPAPNDIRLLLVRSDDNAADATDEIVSQ